MLRNQIQLIGISDENIVQLLSDIQSSEIHKSFMGKYASELNQII